MSPRFVNQITGIKLRLGIVGLGKMGLLHWQTWNRISDVEIAAVVDDDPLKASWAADQGVAFFGCSDDLVGLVDAAIIATPADLHVSCALPLLRAGIHCLVEKPIAIDFDDGKRLVATAGRNGALLAIGHSERFNPGVLGIFAASAANYRCIEVFRMASPGFLRDPFADVVQDLMIHDLDWAVRLVQQTPSNFQVLEAQWLDDSLSSVRCELNFSSGPKIILNASRIGPLRRREVVLSTVHGTTRAIDLEVRLSGNERDPLTLQAHAFLDALRGKPSQIATGEEALFAMALGDRIRADCEEYQAATLQVQ